MGSSAFKTVSDTANGSIQCNCTELRAHIGSTVYLNNHEIDVTLPLYEKWGSYFQLNNFLAKKRIWKYVTLSEKQFFTLKITEEIIFMLRRNSFISPFRGNINEVIWPFTIGLRPFKETWKRCTNRIWFQLILPF